jgi:hypothetical protein
VFTIGRAVGVNIVTDEPLYAAVAVCDDGKGHYSTAYLNRGSGSWSGACPVAAERVFVQAADMAGNVTNSGWQTPELLAVNDYVLIGLVMNSYAPLLPDLIVTDVVLDQNGRIAVTIHNVGAGWVNDDFWLDLCFMNSNLPGTQPPRNYNDVCKGRSHDYLVWAVPGAETPIPPGGSMTLYQAGADPSESVFERIIPANTPIYAHVDSTNANSNYGGVWEEHERANAFYNNILEDIRLNAPIYPLPQVSPSAVNRRASLPARIDPTAPALPATSSVWLPSVAR